MYIFYVSACIWTVPDTRYFQFTMQSYAALISERVSLSHFLSATTCPISIYFVALKTVLSCRRRTCVGPTNIHTISVSVQKLAFATHLLHPELTLELYESHDAARRPEHYHGRKQTKQMTIINHIRTETHNKRMSAPRQCRRARSAAIAAESESDFAAGDARARARECVHMW